LEANLLSKNGRVPAIVAAKPEFKNVEPFKSILFADRKAIAKLTMPSPKKKTRSPRSRVTDH
jgi:hypothetical protein